MPVVNVSALLTGNATSLTIAAQQGKASMAELSAAYKAASGSALMSSNETQVAMARNIAATQAAAKAAATAAVEATSARNLAAAQAVVAADRESLAYAKAAAASTAASQAKVRADALGTQSAQVASAAQTAAAERAAHAATLASAQKVAADGKVAAAANAEAAAVAKAMATEEAAMAASARAHELASAQKIEAHRAAVASIAKAGAVLVGAAALVGVGAVAMAADFEKSTMRLHTSGGIAMDEVQKMRDGILQISQTVGIGASEMADGMYDIVSGGFAGAEALHILKAAAQGAKAEGADLSIMAQGLTAIMATYHIPADQAVQTTNALSAASGLAKGSLQEFTGSLSTVLPIAAKVGISFAEVSAATAVMTQHGTSANEATQELRNAILNLTKPNEVASKLMQQLGISAQDVSQNLGTRGLGGTLNYLTETILASSEGNQVLLGTFKESEQAGKAMTAMLEGMPPQLKQWSTELMEGKITSNEYTLAVNSLGLEGEALGDQFLRLAKKSAGFSDTIKKGGPETISYTAALATMMGGTTGLQVALDLTGGSAASFADATMRVADAQKIAGENVATNAATQATVAAAWERLTATVGVLAIQLGTVLLPAAQSIIGAFSDMIRWFQEHETATKILGITLAVLGGALITVAAAAFLVAHPFVAVALVIGLFIAALVTAYEKCGWFRDFVNGSWQTIQDVVGGVGKWFTETLVPGFQKGLGDISAFFTDSFAAIDKWGKDTLGMFDDFSTNTQETVQKWSDDTTGMFEDFNTNTQGMFDDFFRDFGAGWEGYWKDPIGETENFIKITTDGFQTWNKETSTNFTTWMSETTTDFQNWNKDTSADLKNWRDTTLLGFQNWNKDTSTNLTKWIDDTLTGFQGWNKDTSANFTGWRENNTGTVETFNRDTNGMFVDWKRNTEGMVKDWWTNTEGMFRDWSTNTQTGYENWKNSLTGKTKTFVVDTETNIRDFNTTTQGMFDDFTTNTEGMFSDMWGHVGAVWKWVEDRGQDAANWYNSTIQPAINRAATGVGQAFENMKNWASGAWNALKEIARAPVDFVINTVYNNGIRSMWNPIATTFGLPQLPKAQFADGGIAPVRGYAHGGIENFEHGGIMSGYTPGHDDRLIAVGGGEAIMRPEWTKMVGPNGVAAMNSMAKANDGAGVRGAMAAIGSTRGFAEGGVFDPAGFLGQIAGYAGTGKGSQFGNMILNLPVQLIGALVNKFTSALAIFTANQASIMQGSGAGYDGSGGRLAWPAPGGRITQGYHSGHNGLDIANAMGSPVIAADTGFVNFRGWSAYGGGNEVHVKHPSGLETWYAHLNGFSVGNGQNIGRGQLIGPMGSSGNSTGSHVHFMTLNGGWPNHMNPSQFFNQGGVVPTFDRGGTLAPGLNMVNNATGKPETVRPTDDLAKEIGDAIRDALSGATFRFDGKEISGMVHAKLVLAIQRRAGYR